VKSAEDLDYLDTTTNRVSIKLLFSNSNLSILMSQKRLFYVELDTDNMQIMNRQTDNNPKEYKEEY